MMVTIVKGWARAVANVFFEASADVGEWVIGISAPKRQVNKDPSVFPPEHTKGAR
jgi:hypothetical protein